MSNLDKTWELPVPSTSIANGVKHSYSGVNALLKLDYYDEKQNDQIMNCGIKFKMVVAFRHLSEGFGFIKGSYDTLIEIKDSIWVSELSKMKPEWTKNYGYRLRHFAVYFDSNGLFEFICDDYEAIEPQIGKLDLNE